MSRPSISHLSQLAETVQQAHRDIMHWSDRELQAVIRGDLEALPAITEELSAAPPHASGQGRRDAAMVAFKDHTAEHGCI
jgi:hypothetical protein